MQKKKKETFIQSILALMFSQVVVKILGLVYKLYLTNRSGFGDEGNAIYSAGFQIYALLLTLSSVGVPNAVSKLVAERGAVGDNKGAYRIFKISLCLFAVVGLIGSTILFLGANFISNKWLRMPEAELTIITLSPSIFFVSINSVFRGYFNGRENMKATANSQTIEQLIKTLATISLVEFFVVFVGRTNTKIMAAAANLATTIATIISFGYLYRFYIFHRKEISLEIKQSINYKKERIIKVVKKILFVCVPISLSSILTSINKNIDSVTVVRGLEDKIGYEMAKIEYGILGGKVDTLINLPLSFNIAFATALVPTLASAKSSGNLQKGKKRINFSLLVAILIALPCSIGYIAFADEILALLFPNASQGGVILQISAISIFFIAIEQTVNGALQGIGKTVVPTIAISIGVIIKAILNLILIPVDNSQFFFSGVKGAAVATVICHIISSTIGLIYLKSSLHLKIHINKTIIKPLISTILMILITRKAYNFLHIYYGLKIAFLISVLIALGLYFLFIIIFHIFNKEEILTFPSGEKIYNILKKLHIYSEKS